MKPAQDTDQVATLTVRNIGGINETEVSLLPGVNVLVGRNATNRTSLLQALMAALGSDRVSLKGDAKEGRAELTIGDATYSRTLTRTNGSISFDGEPYLDSDAAELANLFAFLLETNEARQAVAQQRDLREVIMRPVDTEVIKRQIDDLTQEKQKLDAELDELEAQQRKLPDLEQQRTRLERQIEEKREQLAAKEADLEAVDTNLDDPQTEQSEQDEKFEELREARATLEEIRIDIETQEDSLQALHEEYETLESEIADLPDVSNRDQTDIKDEIDRLRTRKQTIDATLNELQTVIKFNEEMLEGTSSDIAAALRETRANSVNESVTDALLDADEQVVCWTCGSEVDTTQIESTLERLRTLRQDKLQTRNSVTNQIGDLEEEHQSYEATQREQTQLQQQLTQIESEIESREATLEDLRQQREDLQTEIEQLEQTVEELETAENDKLLTLHKEANQLEFELGQLERELEDVAAEVETIEADLEEQDRLQTRRAEVQTELQRLRSRIGEIETNAVTRFNEHMDAILDLLDYTNLERIWIERIEQPDSDRRQQSPSKFELHIVRRTDDGTTYEDTINHLSESEREVTGLVFALAGYLVHDVYDTLPFIILDSLEAIDSQRIATLVDYLSEYAEYLTVALLPEDATALDENDSLTEF